MNTRDAAAEAPATPALDFAPLQFAVIAIGGMLGALARHSISVIAPGEPGDLPLATLLVNLIGSLGLGIWAGALESRGSHPLLRPFIVVGIFGSFTTFSTFALETVEFVRAGNIGMATAYVASSILAGVLCFLVGQSAGRRVR